MSAVLELEVEDQTGQSRHRARDVPDDATVGQLVASLTQELNLPDQDAQGRPVLYGASTVDTGPLNPSDKVGDVLQEKELVTLTRSVTAG